MITGMAEAPANAIEVQQEPCAVTLRFSVMDPSVKATSVTTPPTCGRTATDSIGSTVPTAATSAVEPASAQLPE